jgi:hypothetical protein
MKKFIVCFCLFVITSCYNKQNGSSTDNEGIKKVVSLNSETEPSEELPEYKNVEIVPLSTNDNVLIGFITKVKTNGTLIFVSDIGSNLFVFNKNGDFLNKIGSKGQGPEEYVTITSFFIDEVNDYVVVVDGFTGVFLSYDFNGKFISKKQCPVDEVKLSDDIFMLDDRYLLLNYNVNPWENIAYKLLNVTNWKTYEEKSYKPISISDFMLGFSKHPFAKSEEGVDFIMPLNDTIFNCSNEKFIPKYVIEHSQQMANTKSCQISFDKSFMSLCMEYGKNGYFTGFSEIFETKEHILLNNQISGIVLGYYLVNKNQLKGKYYMHSTDEEVNQLPFFHIITTDGNSFISVIQPENLLYLKEKIVNNSNDPYLKKLKEVIDNLRDDDNPILIFYELKDDFVP